MNKNIIGFYPKMLYLTAYYDSAPPENIKIVKESFYGIHRCGGVVYLYVLDLQTVDDLLESQPLWIVDYKQEKYVYVFTAYSADSDQRDEKNILNILLSSLEYKIHHSDMMHIILSESKICKFGKYKFDDDSLYLDDEIIESDELEAYIEQGIIE